ncbi:MAG: hypothetical protein FWH01_06965 [Oscillospiraceae bacterium]|nr:hypothetical protein [Oscillospiraceae bacterium]
MKKSIAFFDIKAKAVPPVVFVVVLALYGAYFYLMQVDMQAYSISSQYLSPDGAGRPVQTSLAAMAVSILVMLLINIVSFVYLDAVVRDAKNEEYTARDCVNSTLKHFMRLTGVTIIKNTLITIGMFMFIVPAIYLAILLIFAECTILDKDSRVFESLKFSRTLTSRRRGEIFKIELFCNLIIAVFVILLLSIFSTNNNVVFQYILMFTLSICTLIEFKLVAHLYADVLATFDYDGKNLTPTGDGRNARDGESGTGDGEGNTGDGAGDGAGGGSGDDAGNGVENSGADANINGDSMGSGSSNSDGFDSARPYDPYSDYGYTSDSTNNDNDANDDVNDEDKL